MLRSLLSPLSERLLGPSPSTPSFALPEEQPKTEATPEDFARYVLVEIMRNSLGRLKVAQGLTSRSEVNTFVDFTGLRRS